MSHLFWLDQERLNRIKHIFPKPRGVARVDDCRVLSGIIHVIRNGLRWRDDSPTMGHIRRFTTDGTRKAIESWLESPLMVGSEHLWPGRFHERLHISTRQ